MKTLALLTIIALNTVNCIDLPSWATQEQNEKFKTCMDGQYIPECQTNTCADQYAEFNDCVKCENKLDSLDNLQNCIKDCGKDFTDNTADLNDPVVSKLVNKYNSCISEIKNHQSLLALSAFFLAAFALLF
ncbi:hypothetical protein ABPG74_013073 [Tetrahymena malaccensis]